MAIASYPGAIKDLAPPRTLRLGFSPYNSLEDRVDCLTMRRAFDFEGRRCDDRGTYDMAQDSTCWNATCADPMSGDYAFSPFLYRALTSSSIQWSG